jgi:hypothetical protein
MVAEFLGKGGGLARQACDSAANPTVPALDSLGVFLANQMPEVRQQGGEFLPAVGGVEIDFDAFQPGQVADSGLVSLAHRDSEYLFGFTAIGVQNPYFFLLGAHKRLHLVNPDLEITLAARLDLHAPAPQRTTKRNTALVLTSKTAQMPLMALPRKSIRSTSVLTAGSQPL